MAKAFTTHSGLTERTIFIFTSDNGGLHVFESPNTPSTHNTPFRAGKGYLEEGGLREPLIVRWPGHVKAGVVEETPVVLYDFMPTLLTAAGVDVAHTLGPIDGVNILPVLTGGTIPDRTLYWHFPNYTNQGSKPAGAVRDGNWKMIVDDETGNTELYDIAADPGEKNDLAKACGVRALIGDDGETCGVAKVERRANGYAESGFRRGFSQAAVRGHR